MFYGADVSPTTSGQNLGDSGHKWNLYAQNLYLQSGGNAVRDAAAFSGATAGAQIVAAIADLPSTGGVVDARGLVGGTISANIFSGITKPVLLLLGQGTYNVSVELAISSIIGGGIIGSGRGFGSGGSTLKWTGAANGTIMSVGGGVQGCHFSDFRLDGNATAAMGLQVKGLVGASTLHNVFDRIDIWNVTGATPVFMEVGSSSNPDVSGNTFRDISFCHNTVGAVISAMLRQRGTQTVGNRYFGLDFTYTGTGVTYATVQTFADFIAGDVRLEGCNFLGPVVTAQVQLGVASYWTEIDKCDHENGTGAGIAGPAYKFISGNSPYSRYIRGCRLQWNDTGGGNVIEYTQNGVLSIEDCYIDTPSGAGVGVISLTNTAGSGVAHIKFKQCKVSNTAITTTIGANLEIEVDSSPGLTFDGSAPAFSDAIYSDQSGYGRLFLYSPDPRLTLRAYKALADADEATWDYLATPPTVAGAHDGTLLFRSLNDARSSAVTWLQVNRGTGTAVSSVTLPKDLNLTTTLKKVNNIATVSGGVPAEYATLDLLAQGAIAGPTTLYTTPAAIGQYRVTYSLLTKTVGNAVNLALVIGWTTPDDASTAATVTSANVAINSAGAHTEDVVNILCKASTAITYQTTLSGAIGTGTFDVFVKLEKL